MKPGPFACVAVGLDGSETSSRALAWTAERLRPGGTLHLVHASVPEAERAAAGARLEGVWSEPARTVGASVQWVTSTDDPSDALMQLADEVDADAVVVGAHGVGGAGRRLPFLGSVTRKLLVRSRRPLIVHNEPATSTRAGPVIGCVGHGQPAEAAAEWAAHYAAESDRSLVLLHAVSNRPIYPIDSLIDVLGSYLGPGVDVSWAIEDLDSLRDELVADHPDLDVQTTVVRGSAVRAILEAGRGQALGGAAELVVLGRGPVPAASPLPRTPRLHQVIARSTCPIAVVPACPPDAPE